MSLPFKTPEPEQKIKVGDKKTGTVEIPVYGGLLTGEGIAVAKLFQKISRDLKKAPADITEADLVDYKPDLAMLLLKYRLKGGSEVTRKYINNLPWHLVDQMAQIMIGEIVAESLSTMSAVVDAKEEEEGQEGKQAKKEESQPQS